MSTIRNRDMTREITLNIAPEDGVGELVIGVVNLNTRPQSGMEVRSNL